MKTNDNIHGTCISLKNKGILILGSSGSGKSDLALRAIMQKGAKLVADDRVDITLKNKNLYASCPAAIRGLLEVRGVGLVKFQSKPSQKIDLVVELADSLKKIERLPVPKFYEYQGIQIKKIKLYPFELSSLEKLELALNDKL